MKRMNKRIYYNVVTTFSGRVEIVSYLADTKREESIIAKRDNRRLHLTTTDYEEAVDHLIQIQAATP